MGRSVALPATVAVCPVLAITIESEQRGGWIKANHLRYDIDVFKCNNCGFMWRSCPGIPSPGPYSALSHQWTWSKILVMTKDKLLAIGWFAESKLRAADRPADEKKISIKKGQHAQSLNSYDFLGCSRTTTHPPWMATNESCNVVFIFYAYFFCSSVLLILARWISALILV